MYLNLIVRGHCIINSHGNYERGQLHLFIYFSAPSIITLIYVEPVRGNFQVVLTSSTLLLVPFLKCTVRWLIRAHGRLRWRRRVMLHSSPAPCCLAPLSLARSFHYHVHSDANSPLSRQHKGKLLIILSGFIPPFCLFIIPLCLLFVCFIVMRTTLFVF